MFIHFITFLSSPILVCRNTQNELNDIRFEFVIGKDTSEGIGSELVSAGLVEDKDNAVITANLQKIVDNPSKKVITFVLVCYRLRMHTHTPARKLIYAHVLVPHLSRL